MGLLDEAIREHLELKRQQGADPGEIARVEREALEPVFPDEETGWEEDGDSPLAPELALGEAELVLDPMLQAAEAPVVEPSAESELPAGDQPPAGQVGGQETVELDMEAFLNEEPGGGSAQAHGSVEPVGATDPTMSASAADARQEDDSLEWEVPKRAAQEASPEEIPGQERLSLE